MSPGAQSEDYLRSQALLHVADQRRLESDVWALTSVRDALVAHPVLDAGVMISPEVWSSPRADTARTDWDRAVMMLASLVQEIEARIGQRQRDAANAGLAARNATRAADAAAKSEAAARAPLPPPKSTPTSRPTSTPSSRGPR